jgi:hypothetical protein
MLGKSRHKLEPINTIFLEVPKKSNYLALTFEWS